MRYKVLSSKYERDLKIIEEISANSQIKVKHISQILDLAKQPVNFWHAFYFVLLTCVINVFSNRKEFCIVLTSYVKIMYGVISIENELNNINYFKMESSQGN